MHLTINDNAPVGLLAATAIVGATGFTALDNRGWSKWGDAVTAASTGYLALDSVQILGSQRAGVLFQDAAGNLMRGRIAENQYGILNGSSHVYTGDNLEVSDNTVKDVSGDGLLPVPNTPPDTADF